MLGIHHYWLFIATAVVLVITPGQDTFFILGRSMSGGRSAGIAAALGISAGSVLHTFAAALGLSALLAASPYAFMAVKFAGAAYLFYIGVRALLSRASGLPGEDSRRDGDGRWAAFRSGIVSNLLNPKVALFFLALMPQFIDAASTNKVAAFLALGLTFVALGVVWCLVLAIGAAKLRSAFLRRPSMAGVLNKMAGAMFIALGLKLATARQ
ncbi:MAG TPA: LysE family translocator [Steroidobacteraceae bacterium]|jgi:threonine/homoserine/homoserine lactone efflux protein|nr:LysE family translocator [Steroidobacteraceae bacterium]